MSHLSSKVGSQRNNENPIKCIGNYGKGKMNSSGESLIELCTQKKLCITNTFFDHKLCHRSTWIAPMRNFTTHNGTERRNPIRNQIDFIIVQSEFKHLVRNSRSYGGINTSTDHKMVMMIIELDDHKLVRKHPRIEPKVDISGFNDEEKKTKYKDATKDINAEGINPQERWKKIVENCKQAGKEILGKRTSHKRESDPILQELSKKKHQAKMDINATTCKISRKVKCKDLKNLKKDIKKRLKENEESALNDKLKLLETTKDDSTRYYSVLRDMQYTKPRPLQIKDEKNVMAGTDVRKAEIITKYFQRMFDPEGSDRTIPSYPPTKMTSPFTGAEIQGAAKKLKNGKSGDGIDTLHSEYIKYADITIHNYISDIYNEVAETGNYPKELKVGVLTPIQKPNKNQKSGGVLDHLRPIMLLSVLRKILTICIISRIWDRLKTRIPAEQAAYQGGRSTTEQVLSIKLLAEKAINASDYKVFLSLFDMSKAFDTVNRRKLFTHLERILDPDELHLLSVITFLTEVKVKVNNTLGTSFTTMIGIMQGDCLSALLFIFYLAECLINEKDDIRKSILITPKYADDVTYALNNVEAQVKLKNTIPVILKDYDLSINETKTEEYEIPKPPPPPPPPPTTEALLKHKKNTVCWSALDWLVTYKPPPKKDETPDWKRCKLLGSLLGTQEDFARRKHLTLTAITKYDHIFKSKHINNKLKIRTFQLYISSVFLYNSETWAINQTLINKIDSFHRRTLRYALNIKWPKKINNNDLYTKTRCEPWSKTIKRRRLNFLGHIMRLNNNTPVRRALKEATTPTKGKIGRPNHTWIKTITEDL